MDKKRYVNLIHANSHGEIGEVSMAIYKIAELLFGKHYNKVIPDIHGDLYMIIEADEDGFDVFQEVVDYKFPNICDFDI